MKKRFFCNVLGFTSGWDYKHYNEYTSQKIVNLSTNKFHLKYNVVDSSVMNGLRQLLLYSFALDKRPGFNVFCDLETVHYKKVNKIV